MIQCIASNFHRNCVVIVISDHDVRWNIEIGADVNRSIYIVKSGTKYEEMFTSNGKL